MSFLVKTASVGQVVGRQTVDVSFRMTSAYAAVIGAQGAIYLDDGIEGGPVAPPAFMVVLEWPLLLRQPYIGLIGAASDAAYFEVLLHAFHDTHVHRLARPGDRLEVVATLAQVCETRAGALAVCRIDTHCARSGDAVATSWVGSLFRGCRLEAAASQIATPPPLPAGAPAGAPPSSEPIAIPRALPFVYTECSGHWNPIHTERAFARAAGYPDVVVHGTCTWAMACERLIALHADGDPQRLTRYGARFSNLLTPDQSVTLAHTALAGDAGTVHFSVSDAHGKDVISRGIATFRPQLDDR